MSEKEKAGAQGWRGKGWTFKLSGRAIEGHSLTDILAGEKVRRVTRDFLTDEAEVVVGSEKLGSRVIYPDVRVQAELFSSSSGEQLAELQSPKWAGRSYLLSSIPTKCSELQLARLLCSSCPLLQLHCYYPPRRGLTYMAVAVFTQSLSSVEALTSLFPPPFSVHTLAQTRIHSLWTQLVPDDQPADPSEDLNLRRVKSEGGSDCLFRSPPVELSPASNEVGDPHWEQKRAAIRLALAFTKLKQTVSEHQSLRRCSSEQSAQMECIRAFEAELQFSGIDIKTGVDDCVWEDCTRSLLSRDDPTPGISQDERCISGPAAVAVGVSVSTEICPCGVSEGEWKEVCPPSQYREARITFYAFPNEGGSSYPSWSYTGQRIGCPIMLSRVVWVTLLLCGLTACLPCGENPPVGCIDCDIDLHCIDCQVGYFLQSGYCLACQTGCNDCEAANECKYCSDGFALVTGQCIPCNHNCLSCFDDPENCMSCREDFKLDANNQCHYKYTLYLLLVGGVMVFGLVICILCLVKTCSAKDKSAITEKFEDVLDDESRKKGMSVVSHLQDIGKTEQDLDLSVVESTGPAKSNSLKSFLEHNNEPAEDEFISSLVEAQRNPQQYKGFRKS